MSLNLTEKINLLQDTRREEKLFSDLEKYVDHAEQLLEKAIISLKQDAFNPAAYMVAYSLLTIFLPLTKAGKNDNNTFWEDYRLEFEQMVKISARFKKEIQDLGARFLIESSSTDYPSEAKPKEDSNDEDEKEGTRAFKAVKERIANITFSDSPRDIKERPKFYLRFKLSENGLPDGRFKQALVERAKSELYTFRTENSENSYITSYCLIYVVMPYLGFFDNSMVDDWLKIKQRHKR